MAGRSKDFAPLFKFVAVTPAATLYPASRAVLATVAGTITGVSASGDAYTAIPVVVGVNWVQVTSITAATATGLFLAY